MTTLRSRLARALDEGRPLTADEQAALARDPALAAEHAREAQVARRLRSDAASHLPSAPPGLADGVLAAVRAQRAHPRPLAMPPHPQRRARLAAAAALLVAGLGAAWLLADGGARPTAPQVAALVPPAAASDPMPPLVSDLIGGGDGQGPALLAMRALEPMRGLQAEWERLRTDAAASGSFVLDRLRWSLPAPGAESAAP